MFAKWLKSVVPEVLLCAKMIYQELDVVKIHVIPLLPKILITTQPTSLPIKFFLSFSLYILTLCIVHIFLIKDGLSILFYDDPSFIPGPLPEGGSRDFILRLPQHKILNVFDLIDGKQGVIKPQTL